MIDLPSDETIPSSTTNEGAAIEEIRVTIVEDDNTVYITILDDDSKCNEATTEELTPQVPAEPYFSQHLYESTYSFADLARTTTTKMLYNTITFPEVRSLRPSESGETKKAKQVEDVEFKCNRIGKTLYTLAPTNCNYINHVHWTNTYPMAFLTKKNSHKYLCGLRELYQKKPAQRLDPALLPIDMRCDMKKLPQPDVSKLNQLLSPSTYSRAPVNIPAVIPQPLIAPVSRTTPAAAKFDNLYKNAYYSTSYMNQTPHQHYNQPNQSTSAYVDSSYQSHSHRSLNPPNYQLPVAQPVDVAYARRYLETQPNPGYRRYGHRYKMTPNLEKLWNTTQHYTDSYRPPSMSSKSVNSSFIDIPIRSPTFNLDLPPIRIPIKQFTKGTKGTLPPIQTLQRKRHHAPTPSILKDFLTSDVNYFNNSYS